MITVDQAITCQIWILTDKLRYARLAESRDAKFAKETEIIRAFSVITDTI